MKEALFDSGESGQRVWGRQSGHIPDFGEINPDRVLTALSTILGIDFQSRSASYAKQVDTSVDKLLISRGLIWCAGCPHRASFWSLNKAIKGAKIDAYVTGDIGCYTLDVFPEGKCQMNLLHAMGSSIGLAAGLGQLGRFGHQQPVVSICGDSTFFHSAIPALINAVYNNSNLVHIVLDNEATAMTGFQAHPGVGHNAMGEPTKRVDIEKLCAALDVPVETIDPFDIKAAIKTLRDLINMENGVRVLIMRRACELVRMKAEKIKPFTVKVKEKTCKGEECGICSSAFRCPAFVQDILTGTARIKEEICAGCGVCVEICPFNAITQEEISS